MGQHSLIDVIVVGGGPVGSQVACRLAEMGHNVSVLERKGKPGTGVCCTGVVSLECVRNFAISQDIILREINGARIFSPSGRVLEVTQKDPLACVLDRAAFDIFLAERARRAGVTYLFGSEVISIETGTESATVRIKQPAEPSELEARALVLASGPGSKLVEEYGLGRTDLVLGVQVEVDIDIAPGDENKVAVYLGRGIAPGFFAWLVPPSSPKAYLGLMSRHSAESYLRKLLSSLAGQGEIASEKVRLNCRGVALKPLRRTYDDRLLVVGSAAGQVKPITGGGIYFGLLCADIAASNLHRALANNNLTRQNLAAYQRGWQKKLGPEIKTGQYARSLYQRLSDHQCDILFKMLSTSKLMESLIQMDDFSFDWQRPTILRLLRRQLISRALGSH